VNGAAAALAVLAVLLASGAAGAPAHYTPRVGDGFVYTETVTVTNGTGTYDGYTETTYVNGSIEVDAVAPNGSVTGAYDNTDHYVNNSRGNYNFSASGMFFFDAANFSYLYGTTDNQTGYTNPAVWFWANNSLPVGGHFYDLDTEMTVTSIDADYHLGTAAGDYVRALAATGSGEYLRDDSYGKFNASYDWSSFYDNGTGYILGYRYVETDSDGRGDGFTYTDRLAVTMTTYSLTAAPVPAAASPSPFSPELIALLVVLVIVVVVVVIALALRNRRGRPLPKHSATGQPSFVAPPPGAGVPPVRLTPSGEPAVQQIVVHETIKVKCTYCGGLIDAAATQCPFCGAART